MSQEEDTTGAIIAAFLAIGCALEPLTEEQKRRVVRAVAILLGITDMNL